MKIGIIGATGKAGGIHILALIEINEDGISTSEFLAGSVNTNPAFIRKIMGMLKKAGLVNVRPGIAGAELAKDLTGHLSVPQRYLTQTGKELDLISREKIIFL